jgi:nucleotide-binding universal stress UspA family protein
MSSSTQTLLTPSVKNILFATDFSPCSQAAIPYMCAIAEAYGSTIHVVHVLTPEPMLELLLDISPELDADRDVAQSMLKAQLAGKPFANIPSTATAVRGPLWDVLAASIEEMSIDLIVLGTHGRHGLKKLVLGSIAEQVFRLARCPVLTVGPQAINEGIVNARFGTILFATDFSFGSQDALPYAVSLARTNSARLILLHVVTSNMEIVPAGFGSVGLAPVELSPELIAEALSGARHQLEELVPEETFRGLKHESIVERGPAAKTILEVARNRQASLIVMGAHPTSVKSLVSHLPWATASTVVCQAHCPVLTVRS